jgi:hypothetical protein
VLDEPAHRANIARFDFLDPRASDYYPDYDGALSVAVALLRTEAGRAHHDKDLTELIGELATRSESFRAWWGTHDVRTHRGGIKKFNHPVVGYLELAYDSMELVAADGLVLTAYTGPQEKPPGRPIRPLLHRRARTSPSPISLHMQHRQPQRSRDVVGPIPRSRGPVVVGAE